MSSTLMRGFRFLRRQPIGFWLVAAMLGLSVATVGTIGTIVHVLIVSPVPVPDPERLFVLGGLAYGAGLDDPPQYWSHAQGLDSIALYRAGDLPADVETGRGWLRIAEVSEGFFTVFRTRPVKGRAISHDDEAQSLDVAVISDSFWTTHLLRRERVLGEEVRLGDRRYTIVGVAPPGFDFPPGTQAWIPRARLESRRPTLVEGASELAVVRRPGGWVARVRDDATPEQVRSQLEALLNQANETLSPKTGVKYGEMVGITPLVKSMTRGFEATLWTLIAGATIMLAVATVNCALFALGVAIRRRSDLATRHVLGASSRRLMRHLIADTVAIGAVSGVLGLVVSVVLLRLAERSLHAFGVELGARPVAHLAPFALSLALGLLAGLAGAIPPAVQLRRIDMREALAGLHPSGMGRRHGALRKAFLAVQMAAAVVLAVGSMLTVRTFLAVDPANLTDKWSDVAAVRLWMRREALAGQDMGIVQRALLNDTLSVPGVSAAAVADRLAIQSGDRRFQQVTTDSGATMASVTESTGDYFGVIHVRIQRGRSVSQADGHGAVVNETLARTLWPHADPLGQPLRLGARRTLVVTGIAEDARTLDDRVAAVPEIYVAWTGAAPAPPGPAVRMALLVKCTVSCRSVLEAVHERVTRFNGTTVFSAGLGPDLLRRVTAPARIRMFLCAIYALLTVGTALVGIFAFVAFAVALRRYEVGVRIALGSTRAQAVRLIVKEGVICAMAGIIAGSLVARWLGSLFQGMVFGGQPADWRTIVGAGVAILACSMIASVAPALRISGREPLDLVRRV